MINAENVKYYDRVLSQLFQVANNQIHFEELKELCDGDADLARVIGREFDRRDFASLIKTSLYYSIILKRNGEAAVFIKNGGFQAEYEKLHPPKTKAQRLNDYFYMIVENEGIIPIEEDSTEVHNMNSDLETLGLIEKSGDWLVPSKAGKLLAFSERTVQDYIKKNNPFANDAVDSKPEQAVNKNNFLMEIFISHSSSDVDIVEALVNLIRKALNISSRGIRCTSLDGYRLSTGAVTDEVLRNEIFNSKAFVAVITSNSIQSNYVTFELGARWGSRLPLFPLVCDPAGTSLLKAPLTGMNAMSATNPAQIQQFTEDLGKLLGRDLEPASSYHKEVAILRDLCSAPQKFNQKIPDEWGNIHY